MAKLLSSDELSYFEILGRFETDLGNFIVTRKGNLLLEETYLCTYHSVDARELLDNVNCYLSGMNEECRVEKIFDLVYQFKPIFTLLNANFFEFVNPRVLGIYARRFLRLYYGIDKYIQKFNIEEI